MRRPIVEAFRPAVAIAVMCNATASGAAGSGVSECAAHQFENALQSARYALVVFAALALAAKSRARSATGARAARAVFDIEGSRTTLCMLFPGPA
jgi:hypothetical protein